MGIASPKSIARWACQTRCVVAIAAAWLIIDFVTLPRTSGVWRAIDSAMNALLLRARPTGPHAIAETAYIVRQGDTITLVYDFVEADPIYVGTIIAFPSRRITGWWAPTREGFRTELLTYADIPLEPEQWQTLRMSFAAHLESLSAAHMRDFAQAVRDGKPSVQRPLLWGYARNAMAVIMACIVFLAVCERALSRVLSWKDGRAIRRGCCPKCGYFLRHEIFAGCPECGWRRE